MLDCVLDCVAHSLGSRLLLFNSDPVIVFACKPESVVYALFIFDSGLQYYYQVLPLNKNLIFYL